MREGFAIRDLERPEWPEAMTLAGRAFAGEPFIAAMFGPAPIRRFEGALRLFRTSEWHDDEHPLGAFVGGTLVGLCVVSPRGRCQICTRLDRTQPPDDPELAIDWQFQVNVQDAHSDQGVHAWLSKLLVDPALRGAGIGRALMGEAVARVSEDGAVPVLLECQPHREPLYASCGFERVKSVPDPAGPPPAALMRRGPTPPS